LIQKISKLYEKNPLLVVVGAVFGVGVIAWVLGLVLRPRRAAQDVGPAFARLPGPGVGLPMPPIPQVPVEMERPQWLERPPEWLAGLGKTIRDIVIEATPDPVPTPALAVTPQPDAGLIERLQADIERVTRARRDPEARAYFAREWGGVDAYLAAQRQRLGEVMRGDVVPDVTPTPPARVRDAGLIERLQADIERVTRARRDPAAIAYFARQYGGIDAYLAAQRRRLEEARR